MLPANGLYGHIRNNTLKSAALVAGFFVLIALFWYAWCIIFTAIGDIWLPSHFARDGMVPDISVLDILYRAGFRALDRWMIPVVIATGWLIIAYLLYADLIRLATRAKPVTRSEHPRLYKIVERITINAGLPMPRIEIMRSGALNAYAAGLSPDDAVVAVTWGLLDALNDDELEAVIAHEITHIKNYDVRLMVVASVFAGGLTMLGDAVAAWVSSGAQGIETAGSAVLHGSAGAASDEDSAVNWMAIAAAIILAIAFLALVHLFAILIRFAISRSREYLADAGAVELTKNPDAMISALRRISENDEIPNIAGPVQAMMISSRIEGLLSTHPSIEDRIIALQKFAGGRAVERRTRPALSATAAINRANSPALPAGAVGFGRRRTAQLPRR